MKPRFAIQFKFLLVTTLLLVVCIASYLVIAVHIFRQDKRDYIFETNRARVNALASEFETEFRVIADQLRLYTLSRSGGAAAGLVHDLIEEHADVVYIAQMKSQGAHSEIDPFVRNSFLKTYGLSDDFFTKSLPEKITIPMNDIEKKGEATWNATVDGGAPLIGFGRAVIEEGPNRIPVAHSIVISYIHPEHLLLQMQSSTLHQIGILSETGHILLHSDPDVMQGKTPTILGALAHQVEGMAVRSGVVEFEQGDRFLGAFARSPHAQMMVAMATPSEQAFSALEALTRRSLIFGLIKIGRAHV